MTKNRFILIDNPEYLEYFMSELKDQYVPIVTETYLKSFFETKGIEVIGVEDYLSGADISKIYSDTFLMTHFFLDKLDEANTKVLEEVFEKEDFRFFYMTLEYSFQCFVANVFRFLRGMELIIQRKGVSELSYLHDGTPQFLCGNRQQLAFSFQDDIPMRIMEYWGYNNKPEMVLLPAPPRNPLTETTQQYLFRVAKGIKRFIGSKRRLLINKYSPSKRTLLFLSPLYDFSFVPNSTKMNGECNIVLWDIDNSISPEFLRGQPVHPFFRFSREEQVAGIMPEQIIEKLNFDIEGLERLVLLRNFRFLSFVTPLIKNYLERKLLDIIRYWRAIENIHKTTKIDILFWGNPTIRYPGAIVNEFCRLNKIPRVGMQHGGIYGSHVSVGGRHYHNDYGKCDFYFTYGFNKSDIDIVAGKEYPDMLPVGSPRIFGIANQRRSCFRKKTRVRVLYPLPVPFATSYFTGSVAQIPANELFFFQKQIVDLLIPYAKYGIVITFPPSYYARYPLRLYLESIDTHGLIVKKNTPFTRILKKYEADIILVDVNSTPLNECITTKSNILVYNEQVIEPFTKEAATLLSKRAIVCDTKKEYLEQLEKCLTGIAVEKDLGNREFLEKYSIFTGVPRANIIEEISYILRKTNSSEE